MKPDYSEIYAKRADMYERLIRREDRDGNLLPAIRAVRPPKDLDIIDLGAGTGTCGSPRGFQVWTVREP